MCEVARGRPSDTKLLPKVTALSDSLDTVTAPPASPFILQASPTEALEFLRAGSSHFRKVWVFQIKREGFAVPFCVFRGEGEGPFFYCSVFGFGVDGHSFRPTT